MKIAIALPRGMHFGPKTATAIDLCVHDFVRHSAYRETTTVYGEAPELPFEDVKFVGVDRAANQPHQAFVRALGERIALDAPDLLVVHQHVPSALQLAKHLKNAPILLHKHNTPKRPRNFFSRWKMARDYGAFARVLFVSDYSRESFLNDLPRFSARCATQHNGMDLSSWQPKTDRERRVLFVGRAVPDKGTLQAAQAVAKLLETRPDWQASFILSLLGTDANYVARIREALSRLGSRASILTDCPHDIVQEHFEKAAISLMPSVFPEPFGRTAIEAMAGGAALIASRRGGLQEVCAEGALPLEDPESVNEISGALAKLCDDVSLRHKLATEGRARVEERFDLASLSKKLDAQYEAAYTTGGRAS